MKDRYILLAAFLVGFFSLMACDLLVKKPVAVPKKVHYELVMGNIPVMCKKLGSYSMWTHLSDCQALVNGISTKIPDLINASNIMEFENKEGDQ